MIEFLRLCAACYNGVSGYERLPKRMIGIMEAQPQFPPWIRRAWPSGLTVREVKTLLGELHLHTVCQSAHCPNQSECWERRTATFMVLGNVCTRHCAFCAVNSGRPASPAAGEPERVAEASARLGLRHVVITCVTRDDLPDQGSGHIADCVAAVKQRLRHATVEVLVPDFRAETDAIRRVLASGPEIYAHNIETVERLTPKLRDRRFSYRGSLKSLEIAARFGSDCFIKSGFMLGCGERPEEVRRTLEDLRAAGCVAVTMGQYLQPTGRNHPVAAYLTPEQFQEYEQLARQVGFVFAVAGPFVRSSYRSEAIFEGQSRAQASRGASKTAGCGVYCHAD